jgi:hypothetical protein
MRLRINTVVLTVLLAINSCAHHSRYPDLESEPLKVFDFGAISAPQREDYELAKNLSPKLLQSILSSLRDHGQFNDVIAAARYHDGFLLVDIPSSRMDDANTFYVYSLKKRKIIGVFGWYSQG